MITATFFRMGDREAEYGSDDLVIHDEEGFQITDTWLRAVSTDTFVAHYVGEGWNVEGHHPFSDVVIACGAEE